MIHMYEHMYICIHMYTYLCIPTAHFVCRLKLFPNHQHHTAKMNLKLKVFVSLVCTTGFCMLLRGSVLVYPQLQDTSRCACDKCLTEDDPWLMKGLNKSVEPFLSVNYNLSEDDFNWWKVSCHEKTPLMCSYQIRIFWKRISVSLLTYNSKPV